MASSRELILQPADIDRISIECGSCHAEITLSLSNLALTNTDAASGKPKMAAQCPSCPDKWAEVYDAVIGFAAQLQNLIEHKGVTFRVPDPSPARKGE